MYLGNHYLVGKVTKLKNPIGIMKKNYIKNNENNDNNKRNDISVETIFKEKVWFNIRPTPMLNNNNDLQDKILKQI